MLNQVDIATYRGMDMLGQFDLKELAGAFLHSYKNVWSFFFGVDYFYTSAVQKIAYAVLLAASAFACLFAAVKKPARIPGILIGALLLPPCLGAIAILVPEMETDTLQMYTIVFAMLFAVRLAELVLLTGDLIADKRANSN